MAATMARRALAALALVVLASACAGGPESADGGPALYVARDADSTIYLYGTIHLRREGEPWGSPAVEAALAEADEIWTEMEISPEVEGRTQQLALQLGRAPADQPLSSWLTAEENARLAETARRLGVQVRALEPMRPWLAGLTLTLMPMIGAGYDPQAGVDRAIDAYGDANGKRMRAFETPEQQIGFFANLPPQVQREMLIEAIDEADEGPELLNRLSDAWERGDVDALETMLNEDMRQDYPDLYAVILTNRNAAWVETLKQELEGQGVDFVAVGAAHLVGDDGLVALLRAQGVRVERVGGR